MIDLRRLCKVEQLTPWQVEYAMQQGLIPKSRSSGAGGPLWNQPDLEAVDRDQIINTIGTRCPIGTRKAATHLGERISRPLDRDDIDRLIAMGQLHPIGKFKGWDMFSPDHLDAIDPSIFAEPEFAHVLPTASVTRKEADALTAPLCPRENCGGSCADRADGWATACWGHCAEEEKTAISNERVDRKKPGSKTTRNLRIDAENALQQSCPTCLAPQEQECETQGRPVDSHQKRIEAAAIVRRQHRATRFTKFSASDVAAQWRDVVEAVHRRGTPIAEDMFKFEVVACDTKVLTMKAPGQRLALEIQQPRRAYFVSDALNEVFGVRWSLRVKVGKATVGLPRAEPWNERVSSDADEDERTKALLLECDSCFAEPGEPCTPEGPYDSDFAHDNVHYRRAAAVENPGKYGRGGYV